MNSPHAPAFEEDVQRMAVRWRASLSGTSTGARAQLTDLARMSLAPMVDLFYDVLQGDARAARFLTSAQVNQRVGRVHARINVPVDLVARGMGVLRRRLAETLAAMARAETMEALIALNTSMDIAIESMTLAYADAHERSSRTEAAYRLFSLVQNVGTERERQRALLLDWENNLLYMIAGHAPSAEVPHLSTSEFGLWFLHKGLPSFGENAETARISQLTAQVDAALERLVAHELEPTQCANALQEIRSDLAAIRHLIGMLFERIGELDAGSDALTSLLNRRFLPPVLRREIDLSCRTQRAFALIVLDLDHFKRINDTHGHDVGDRALQHVAGILGQYTRGSDYVFRLGGEEFLIVVVSVSEAQALGIAEGLRRQLERSPLALPNGQELFVTASIGLVLYDGDPDYERLMARADAAMYEAKRNGRNRVVLGSPESKAFPQGSRNGSESERA